MKALRSVAYGVLFWAGYQVFVAIGAHVNPTASHMVQDILAR